MPLPTFKLKGQEAVYSLGGGICTLLISMVVLSFALVKFQQLISHQNPNMSSYVKDVADDERLDLKQSNFRIAFAVENYYPPFFLKNDPTYVKWLFRLYGKKDNKSYEVVLPYHMCTEEDYAEFHPIENKSKLLLQSIKEDPDRGFICLDWNGDQDMEIYGNENESNYQRIEVDLVPCNLINTDESVLADGVSPKCDPKLEEQKKYVARSHWLMLVN